MACLGAYDGAGWCLDRLVSLDTVAIGPEGGASITPATYGARAEGVPSLGGAPSFRLTEGEPFSPPTGPYDRFLIPATRVHGTEPLRVQLRYRNVLGQTRTPWRTIDVKRALSRARTLFSFEGQWVEVRDVAGGGVELDFSETTDDVATVTYSIDGGPEHVLLPVGQKLVALASKPSAFTVELRTVDGVTFTQRIVAGKIDFSYRAKP